MGEFYIKGKFKSIDYFLQNGWKAEENYIIDIVNDFSIYYEELNAELNLKEITDYQLKLELEDENGTQYMKDWFEKLELEDEI